MSTMPYTPKVTGTGFRATVQRFGGYLASMVMPNISAFIAWGLITALFIPTGWLPNEEFAKLVGPMITVPWSAPWRRSASRSAPMYRCSSVR